MIDGPHAVGGSPYSSVATGATASQAAEPVVAAAGDIACDPTDLDYNGGLGKNGNCQQKATSDLLVAMNPAAVLAVGDNQYDDATLAQFGVSYDPSWGRVKAKTRPATGRHGSRK